MDDLQRLDLILFAQSTSLRLDFVGLDSRWRATAPGPPSRSAIKMRAAKVPEAERVF